MGQILHQSLVFNLIFALYVAVVEASFLKNILIRYSIEEIYLYKQTLFHLSLLLVLWAFFSIVTLPDFMQHEGKDFIVTRRKFLRIFDKNVEDNCCLLILKLFKHTVQTFYFKTAAGVNATRQQRVLLRSSTSHLKCE